MSAYLCVAVGVALLTALAAPQGSAAARAVAWLGRVVVGASLEAALWAAVVCAGRGVRNAVFRVLPVRVAWRARARAERHNGLTQLQEWRAECNALPPGPARLAMRAQLARFHDAPAVVARARAMRGRYAVPRSRLERIGVEEV